jgi:CheY-like chemotaxis protein
MKPTTSKRYPRFILLDDDACVLMMTEKIIRKYFLRSKIITFCASKEAIEFMASEDFAVDDTDTVFLTDLNMPEMDGFAVLDQMGDALKKLGDRLHIFVMSSATCQDEIRKALSYSYVIGFLQKPFSNDKMEHIISCIQYPL